MKKLRFSRDCIRPLIYQIFTRTLVELFLVLLWAHLAGTAGGRRSAAFAVMAALNLLMALAAWLRLDGLKLLRLDRRLFRRRKKPAFWYGDIADHIDDDLPSFEELDEPEQDSCLFAANLAAAAVMMVLALVL